MRQAQICLSVILLVSCAGCGSGYEPTAYLPSTAFVDRLKTKADRLGKSEVTRFNELEIASKGEIRYEVIPNPVASAGAVYFKGYRDYTACSLKDILRGDSYIYPIVIRLVFEYRLMATPVRHTDFADSVEKVRTDNDYKPVREDRVTVDYRCNAFGELADPLPGLMPRDSAINPSWNIPRSPDQPIISPVEAPPPLPKAPRLNLPAAPKQPQP